MGEPKRIPLDARFASRDSAGGKDARLINGFFEPVEKDLWVFKRPGLAPQGTSVGASTGRGVYNWRGDLYAVFGSTLYKNGASHGTVAASGFYTFSQTLGGTPRLFVKNTTNAYTTDGTTFAAVADADYPATTVHGSAFLDGTTYVMTPTAFIHGSDLNDPTAWDPLNVLQAQIEADGGVAAAKQLVYVIAFKEWTTEVFYDRANPTGSPLGPVQGAKQPYGCRAGQGVQNLGDTMLWPGIDRDGAVHVVLMEGVKSQVVSTPAVERLLEQADFSTTYSWVAHCQGHRFYGLTVTSINTTLVYDLTAKMWSQWKDTDDNYWPIVASTFDSSQRPVLQHATNGKLYWLQGNVFLDDSALFTFDLYTPLYDAGSDVGKYCSRLAVVGDRRNGNLLQVRTNDHDYAPERWSTFRTVDMERRSPFLSNMGAFRRRAHNFRLRSAYPLRLEGVDLYLEPCTL